MNKFLSLMAVFLCLFGVPALAYHVYSEEEINALAGDTGAGEISCINGIESKTNTEVNCITHQNGLEVISVENSRNYIPESADLFIPFTTDEDLKNNPDMGYMKEIVYPYSEIETTTESYVCDTVYNEETMEEEDVYCTQTTATQKPNEYYYLMSCSRGISRVTDEGIFCNR